MLTLRANGLTHNLAYDAENCLVSVNYPAPRARLTDDADAWAQTSWFTLSDAPHTLEVDWRAATSAGANDGGLTLWIDGTQQGDLSGVDNDTLRIESARLGLVNGVPTGTRGTFYFDGFESRRSTYIGYAAPGGRVAQVSLWQELAGFLRGLFGGSVSTAGIPAQPRPQPLPAARQPLAAPLEVMFAPPVKRANPAPPAQGANITVTYTYDGDGRRVMSSNGTTTTVYIGK